MSWIERILLGVLLVLVTATSSPSQEITGRIAGVVTDASKALIPGVEVTVEGPTLFAPRTVITAEDASYLVDKLPPGDYKVTISFPGFRTVVQNNVNVRANFTATINATLEVGAVSETLMVTEEAPVVDVKSATTATTFDTELLKQIPAGHDTWSMLEQLPGLAPSVFDVGGNQSFQQTGSQIHGSASSQTVYNVNGLNLNWPGGSGGATAFYFDNDAFEEVTVVTDGAQADIGVGGVQINMITKQGSNQVHGSVSGYYTTHALTSQARFPLFNGVPVETGNTTTMMRDTNVQAGLPLIRDKLWWFNSYRRYDIDLAVPGVKTPDGAATKDNNHQGDVTSRLDYALTPKQKLTLNWLYNDINRFYRRVTTYAFVDDVASGKQLEHAWVGQAQWTYAPTGNLVLESRFGNMTLHFPLDYQNQVKPGTLAVVDLVLSTAKYARPGGATLNYTWHSRFSQNVSYYKGAFLRGSHNVRGGYEYARMSNGNNTTIYGDMTVQLSNGAPLSAILFNTPVREVERNNETAAYVSDSYVLGRLTINAGLRFDRFITYAPAQSSPAGTFAQARSFPASGDIVHWNNFSPRVGVAYDVNGKGRTVIRGSFDQFVLLEGSRLAGAVNRNALTMTTVPFTTLGPNNQPLGLGTPTFVDGGQFNHVDPNLTRPFSRQVTAGYEQQVLGDLRVGVNYFFRKTLNNYARVNRSNLQTDYSSLTVTNPLTNQPLTIYNLDLNVGQSDFQFTNFPRLDDNAYHGVEFNAAKRFSRNYQMLAGFTIQRKRGTNFTVTSDDLYNPNKDIFRTNAILDMDATHVFKLSGTYDLPKGATVSANFQHYTGYPFQATNIYRSGTNAAGQMVNLKQSSVTVPIEPLGAERYDPVDLLNLRFGYNRRISERYRVSPSMDLDNVFNTNTVTSANAAWGPSFKKPVSFVGQRLVKFGLRIEF